MEGHRHVKHAAHQEALAVARGSTRTHTHLRRRLAIILSATAIFALLCTLVTYFTEHGAAGTEIHNLFDAFLFATSQLLTGSSVANPATNLGKVLELVFDLWAIFVVASLAGSFGAFFHARSKEMDLAETKLHEELEGMRGKIDGRPGPGGAERA